MKIIHNNAGILVVRTKFVLLTDSGPVVYRYLIQEVADGLRSCQAR